MSSKFTSEDGAAAAENNSNVSSSIKSSALFGWLAAGSDLIAAKLDTAASLVGQRIDDTHEALQLMQAKGLEVESELKRTLNPMGIVDAAQKIVFGNPLVSVFTGSKKCHKNEAQLLALNAKVDLLVEQVALLAAKKAAAKVASKKSTQQTSTAKATTKSAENDVDEKATAERTSSMNTAATQSTPPASTKKSATTRKPRAAAKRRTSTVTKKTASTSSNKASDKRAADAKKVAPKSKNED